MSRTAFAFLGALLVPTVSLADPPGYLDRSVVAEASRRAVARAGIAPEVGASLSRRARASEWLPEVSVHVARGTGLSLTQYAVNPNDRLLSGDSLSVDVRATISLDRLVFSPHEPTLARLELTRLERRLALEAQVVELLAHLELLSRQLRARPADAEVDIPAAVDFARTRARVELLTGASLDELLAR